jgi:hypothetical protein
MMRTTSWIVALLFLAVPVRAADRDKADDAVRLAILSAEKEPRTVFAVRKRLLDLGGKLRTHLVANRGHDNPKLGSFSFFETYSGPRPGGMVAEGELFLGFFSAAPGGKLAVLDDASPGELMMELIAWDASRQVYNFWELTGDGTEGRWHLRGDSTDILADVADINLGKAGAKFGGRLRCSGCHTLGGPIMKEIEAPYNDWHTKDNPLTLGDIQLDPGNDPTNPRHVAARLWRDAEDAANLSVQVKKGIDRLIEARRLRKFDDQSLRQQLRSLFTTMEMNLATDTVPFARRVKNNESIELPAAFFVDARLAGEAKPIAVDVKLYQKVLEKAGSRFAPRETPGLTESHFAFSVPVRSYIDNRMLDALVREKVLDEELIAAVLAVDITTPVFSARRASLLRYVPETAGSAADLREQLMTALDKAVGDPAARELLALLKEGKPRAAAQAYLETCRGLAGNNDAVLDWWRIASQRRAELDAAETAQNPRGKITEPGFRILFPLDTLRSRPGKLSLDPRTGRAG